MHGARNTTSSEHIHLNATSFSTFELRFPSGGYPSTPTGETGGSASSKYRLFVFVKYGEEFIHHANVSIDNMTWSLTDVFGRVLFRLPYGTYEVKAEKEGLGYPQEITVLMNEHKEDILNLQQVSGFETVHFDIPTELGAGTKTFLLLPVAILVIYGLTLLFKQPKRKWKYSYLK